MPNLSFRSVLPAVVCAGLIVGTGAMTGAAASVIRPATEPTAATSTESISAPLSTITATGESALVDARDAVADARQVAVDIASSGLTVNARSTVVDTSGLRADIDKLDELDVTPALLIPDLAKHAAAETQSVREQTASLRGALDAAVAQKAAEEAAAKAAAEAAAKAQAEAEAAAKAKAEADAAAKAKPASAPAVNVNVDPASAQGIARSMMAANYGWGDDQFACLVSLWNRESGWRVNAASGSGAYGIPQALPGSKMASAGADWQTNPATQIAWGLGYIAGRYGNACGAWGHSQSTGWY